MSEIIFVNNSLNIKINNSNNNLAGLLTSANYSNISVYNTSNNGKYNSTLSLGKVAGYIAYATNSKVYIDNCSSNATLVSAFTVGTNQYVAGYLAHAISSRISIINSSS